MRKVLDMSGLPNSAMSLDAVVDHAAHGISLVNSTIGGVRSTAPILEWGYLFGSSRSESDDTHRTNAAGSFLNSEQAPWDEPTGQLHRAECSYRIADFKTARSQASKLLDSSDRSLALSALVMHFASCIAMGNSESAYEDFLELKARCGTGFGCEDDSVHRMTSILVAMRVESLMVLQVFDIPELEGGLSGFPRGWESYLGFLMAQRAMRGGNSGRAAGISEAFLMLDGNRNPLSRILLLLAIASACMMSGEVGEAERSFRKAWELGQANGFIAPFVELNFSLLGLSRRCLLPNEASEYRRLETMVKTYYDGWYGLREKCGYHDKTRDLTPLESYVGGLVMLGWRNKAIATHLRISENTVKHQLTAIYQKLGVSSRADLRNIMRPGR